MTSDSETYRIYHLMTTTDQSAKPDKIKRLARLSSVMNSTAELLAETSHPASAEEQQSYAQVISTCLAVSRLSQEEVSELLQEAVFTRLGP